MGRLCGQDHRTTKWLVTISWEHLQNTYLYMDMLGDSGWGKCCSTTVQVSHCMLLLVMGSWYGGWVQLHHHCKWTACMMKDCYLSIPTIIQELGVGPGGEWHVIIPSQPEVVVRPPEWRGVGERLDVRGASSNIPAVYSVEQNQSTQHYITNSQ